MCTVTLAVSSVSVAGVNLPVADEMKALGVVLDLTFQKHVMAAARSCNYHSQAIHHIRHLLSRELASTLACSLILTRMDYCNSVLYGTPSSSIQILQRAQNNAARIILQAPRRCHARPLLRNLHWLPIQHRIEYKVAVLTFKSRSSTTAPDIPQSSHQGSRQWKDSSLLYHTTTGQAVHQNRLELVAWNNNSLRLTVCI